MKKNHYITTQEILKFTNTIENMVIKTKGWDNHEEFVKNKDNWLKKKDYWNFNCTTS